MAVKQYAAAMKAVDPTIKIGAVLIGNNEYPDWNAKVLAAACPSFDLAILHWYGGNVGTGLTTLPAAPESEIPGIFSTVRSALATPMFGCPADLPVMVTEWGPNSLSGNDLPVSMPDMAPVGSQYAGLFATESYANFMEQGALAVHWLELHNRSFLAQIDWNGDPFTRYNDTRRWGHKGMNIAHFLAAGNDTMVQATVSGTFGAALKAHASLHADGARRRHDDQHQPERRRERDRQPDRNRRGARLRGRPLRLHADQQRSGRRPRLRADLRGRRRNVRARRRPAAVDGRRRVPQEVNVTSNVGVERQLISGGDACS